MGWWQPLICMGFLCACPALAQVNAAPPISTAIDVQAEDLVAQPVGAHWVSYNGDYSGRRFSSLDQITPSNVAQLRAQWVFHSSASSMLEVTPVVVNGVMFVTAANDT